MALDNYLESVLGKSLCAELNWSATGNSFDFIVSRTLDELDLTAEPDPLTKDVKLVGELMLWRQVMTEFAASIDFSGDGVSVKSSSLFDMAKEKMDEAYSKAIVYLSEYQIGIGGFESESRNPYSNVPYWERDL